MTESPYHQLSVDVPKEEAQLIAGALESFAAPEPLSVTARRMGKGVPWRIEAIFAEAPDEAVLQTFFAEIAPEAGAALKIAPLPEEDWVAMSQAALPPIRTSRFYVRQPHLPLPADLGSRHVLTIEAGLAFGTGHHASTHGCLLALEALNPPLPRERGARVSAQGEGRVRGPSPRSRASSLASLSQGRGSRWPRRVLDLGTGTGLLAIAAQKLWPEARVFASDIDPVATGVARENCRLNEAPAIRCVTAPGFNSPMLTLKFDLVLANILAKPLKLLAREIAAHASPGARLILSGILDEQAADIAATYRLARFRLVRRRDREGWSALTLARLGG